MSTMHCTNNTSNPWSSPKNQLQNPLKRRHTRGNTSHSHTSTSIRSLSLSPAVSSVSLSDTPNNKNTNNVKAYHDFHPQQHQQQQHQRDDREDRVHGSSVASFGAGAKGNFVPSWFGSLRSFAISATTSSKGAFAPLNTAASSPTSSSSSSTSSSPKSSKKSCGRSSSIYYSSTRVFDDDDDDDENDSGSSSDEPVTDLNGLKENRVRGPRVNWMALDPSLGGLFAGSYKPLPTNESENDLSSSNEGGERGCEGVRVSGVEDLGIAEAPYRSYRDDQSCESSGDDGRRRKGGYGECGSGSEMRASLARGDLCEEDGGNAWARVMGDATAPEVGVFTMPVAAPSSTLAFLKSYVPTLRGSGSDSSPSPTATSPTTSATTSSPITPTTPAAAAGGGGLWSLRKLSMNFLNGNQYSAVSDKSALTGEEEDNTREEEESRPREQGRRAGYRDDYDDFDDYGDGRRISHENVGTRESPTTPPVSAGGGGLTVSYLASMVSNATQAGAQYIPAQVRDQLPVAVVSSRGLKKD
ncbi:hypothetical protein EC957_009178 [Mortierella hygrophila]|uniref:Uncharacterized protein n=1 Tax=Mortierella hygrophila TaxID=979708 RepID=A0A9P6FHC3_9FUNG|nr:hypothetical protein EC957_009178 [Mortierella hygrophila]